MNTAGSTAGPAARAMRSPNWLGRTMSTISRIALAPVRFAINAIHPPNVNTDMLHSPPMYRAFRPDLKEPTREEAELVFPVVQAFPIPYVEPEDISEAVVFFASDAARYVTGQQLRVTLVGSSR